MGLTLGFMHEWWHPSPIDSDTSCSIGENAGEGNPDSNGWIDAAGLTYANYYDPTLNFTISQYADATSIMTYNEPGCSYDYGTTVYPRFGGESLSTMDQQGVSIVYGPSPDALTKLEASRFGGYFVGAFAAALVMGAAVITMIRVRSLNEQTDGRKQDLLQEYSTKFTLGVKECSAKLTHEVKERSSKFKINVEGYTSKFKTDVQGYHSKFKEGELCSNSNNRNQSEKEAVTEYKELA